MKTYYITLSWPEVLKAYTWQEDENNYENGGRVLHIFPARIEFAEKGTKDNPYPAAIHFVQAGCDYGPEVRSSSYSAFSLEDLFYETEDFQDLNFNYSEVRADARRNYADQHGLDIDEVEERHLDDDYPHQSAIEQAEDEWVAVAVEENEGVILANRRAELIDEEKKIKYIIIWEVA